VAPPAPNTKRGQPTIESAKSNVVNQEANLVKAKSVADNDTRNAARLEDLHGRRLIAAMDRDNARTNAESSQASLAAAEAQRAAAVSQVETQRSQGVPAGAKADGARAFLKIAQTGLDNARLLAPFRGYIPARNLHPGA